MLNKIAITGEGVTDIGFCRHQQATCSGDDFEIGPVTKLLFKLICHHLPEWNAEFLEIYPPETHFTFLYHAHLGEISKKRHRIRPSKKTPSARGKGWTEHAQRAEALAHYALTNQHDIAAYFHDTDGTNSDSSAKRRADIKEAIEYGFQVAGLNERGLTLLPQPKSEAWFIYAVKPNPYQHCGSLEETLSGNDGSPKNAPKKRLAEIMGLPDKRTECNRAELIDVVEAIDVDRIDMPSFNDLREQVKTAITALRDECRD